MLENKTVILTGANSGIGLAILKSLLNSGSEVIALVRDKELSNLENLNNIKKNHNGRVKVFEINLEDGEAIKTKLLNIIKEHDNISGLVNNAGQIYNGLVQMTPKSEFDRMFDINFFAPLSIIQIIIRKMIKKKSGSIVNVSSTSSEDCAIGRAAYSSSKVALEVMTKTLAYELGRYNIRANCVLPGLTNTKLMRENTKDEIIDEVTKNIALGRIAEPEEIAELVSFLCSDKASYITAQSIRIDGGMRR